MKKWIAGLLLFASLVTLVGCGQAPGNKAESPGKQELPVQVETPAPDTPETTQPAQTEITPPVQTEQPDALSALRAQMQAELIAVADFGFPYLLESREIMDFLQEKYPWWLNENEFVRDMPEEQIILTCDYDTPARLLCIVPANQSTAIRVNVGYSMDDEPSERWSTAYQSTSGDPFLLLASEADGVTVSVDITDSHGQEITWYPNIEAADEEAHSDCPMLDFTPVCGQSAYDAAVEQGWFIPEAETFRTYHYWRSDYRYLLELSYDPDQKYDGRVWLYDYWGMDELVGEDFAVNYQGYWYYMNGVLHLELEDYEFNKIEVEFSVLTDTEDGNRVALFCTEAGKGLPQFGDNMKYDVIETYASDAMSYYDYALYQGWRLPELHELMNTVWQSDLGYALELNDDSVPGDTNGEVILYDVSESGACTASYTGSWSYVDGTLHLLLIPQNNGQFIDDNFPVLMLDGQLMVCMNEYGNGLPNFTADAMVDVLFPSYG